MTSKIRLKRSGTTGAQPNPTNLEYGEITLNYADSTIYFRKVDDTLGSISTGAGGGGAGALRSVTTVNVTSTQTVFSVTGGYTVGAIDVFRNGIKLLPSLDFTASNGTSVTLAIAAENGDVVELLAYNVQSLVSTVARTVTTITATSGQTSFTASGGYTVGYADVYQNGVRLVETDDFTAANGTTIVLTSGAVAGDVIDIVAHTVHGLADGYTTTQADARFQLSSQKGSANGYASLDGSGKVPSNQLPSYVDDILEYATQANFPATGVAGVIYVDTTSNKTYRWGGSSYVEVSAGPSTTDALSEGSTNLYYTDTRARAALSFVAGSGAYNSTSGAITIPTNNNQLTNGAGYITGITSSDVSTALGYTPYNNSNPSGFISIDSAIAMAIALG